MPDEDGLSPLPLPILQPHSTPIERAPDLAAGTVDSGISGTLRSEAAGLGQWMGAVGARASQPGMPKYSGFTPAGGKALGEVESVFEKAVGHDESTLGAFKAVGGALHTGLMRPIAGITDEVQVAEIRDLQKQFLNSQAGRLGMLDTYEKNAKEAMRNLSNWLSKNWQSGIDTSYPRKLMDQKAQVGNDAAAHIAEALDQSDDPDERAKLQALNGDFQNWMQDRDKRVGAEQNELRTLVDRTDGMNSEILRQIGAMQDAGRSIGPRNDEASSGAITGTTHADPGAIAHIYSLRDFLLGSRGRFDRVLGGPK